MQQQFEKQVYKAPDATAITFTAADAESLVDLSYQQLNWRANNIAHYLEAQGALRGTRIGLCLERSVDMVASLLAILKVGAVYVPLDPDHPAERTHYIIQDAQIELLITASTLFGQMPAKTGADKTGAKAPRLDERSTEISAQSSKNCLIVPDPDDVVYILYTSGSTGQPKGIPICHRSLTNFLASMVTVSGITAEDKLLAVTTLGFDIATLEIFLPITTGAQLVLSAAETTVDGEQLSHQLTAHAITIMQATPATWRLLLNAGWQGHPQLRILCGGEALDLALAQQLFLCGSELWNLYGPTETTIWSGVWKIDEKTLEQSSIPIGVPIDNTQFYVLDRQQRQVPIGVAGELYIAGAGLSQGYWQRPALTAASYVEVAGLGRLYRTGDRVRYRENGALDYLGRLDNQVKLRGFRIELSAVEACLCQHASVEQAVVVVSAEENPRLLAYLTVADERTQMLICELRQQLAQRLPSYMLPSHYAVLDAFPLTPNGKINRRALSSLELINNNVTSKGQSPRTPDEKLIAGIWTDILGVEEISLSDHFFELGGHSLLATRVISQVRQIFETEVSLRSLFENPILSDFVTTVQSSQQNSVRMLPSIARTDRLVLSYAQQRQWLMSQMEPDSTAYNIPIAVQLKGALSIASLRQSLVQVARRHDTLRTVYPAVEGIGQPAIKEAAFIDLDFLDLVDLIHLSEKEQRADVTRYIEQQAQQPFDLAQGPLWRSQLLRLSDRDYILTITLHHIITDGWSMSLLLKELTAYYRAHQLNQNLDEVFSSLPIRYTDYAAWQRTLDLSAQVTYWKHQLSGIAPLLALPTDYPRSASVSSAGATYELRLSKRETAALQRFSQRNNVTLFMTLLTAFNALLYRYSGLDDIAIGTPIANRQRAELEGLIGLFVNTLVIRAQIQNNPRLVDLLAQLRKTTLEAYAHQDLPFEQLIDALDVPRSCSHTPLVQVMFALQDVPQANETDMDGDLVWAPLAIDSATPKFDLTLDMKETERGLVGQWEYRADLFSAETIHQMAGHFRTILKSLPDSGDCRLSDLPMLSRQDIKQLRGQKTDATAEPLTTKFIHQLFEQQAAATPDAIALCFEQGQLSYQTLNQRANQLAHYLCQQGVVAQTPVGLWATRSPQTIVAILAILKAGGVYVPLDPHYPLERLQWMVADTNVAVLVAPDNALDDTNAAIPLEIKNSISDISLDLAASQIDEMPSVNLTANLTANLSGNLSQSVLAASTSLAYILYTSGSTGRPKGVCVTHQGVTRLVVHQDYVSLGATDVLLQAAPLTFDASTFEIWGALLNGGKLVLMPESAPSLEALGQAIVSYQVTTLWLTSGLFNLMVDEQLESLASVRQLLAGGDVLSAIHVKKAFSALKNTKIINGYGPTEGTTFTCCRTITAADLNSKATATIPIGHPLRHTQVYVLDADQQLVPPGVPGELYIGGAGIARGYLNRPALTAERFVPNPFYDVRQPVDGECFYLYKTGDRVRYRTDGALEYLGRLDQQVKIRGFRIEPGEIETVLANHPDIGKVAVVVCGKAADEKRLVAYLEPAAETDLESLSTLELRQFLLSQLPDYMVPTKFVWIDALPLTANGKVDKRALPAPQWEVADRALAAASSPAEKILVDIFLGLLPVDSISIDDNFFDLGGDSIVAMQIVSKAAQAGLTITPKQLFEHQTIAELAAVAKSGTQTLGIQPRPSQALATGEVPLAPIQHWFFEQNLNKPAHINQSVTLALPDEFDRHALEVAIAHLYSHHDALRLRFSRQKNGWQQAYSPLTTPPKIQWHDLAQLPLIEQNRTIEQQVKTSQASLNLTDGSLVNLSGFDCGLVQPSQLFITIHHLAVDGVSWRILLADLQQIYHQATLGEDIQLAPKTHSYQRWAEALMQRASTPEIASDIEYWQAISQRSHAQLPQEKTTEGNTVGSSRTIQASLSTELTALLLKTVPAIYNADITEVLLTAFVQTLSAWTSSDTVLIDLESHGRFSTELELSRTVGWFTMLYPVVISLDGEQSIADTIKATKRQLRAVPNQGVSYGLLRYKHQRSIAVNPQVSFNYLGQLDTFGPDAFGPDTPEQAACKRLVSKGHNQATENIRPHLLDFNSSVEANQLTVEWTFSYHYHLPDTITQLSEQFIAKLSAIIEDCSQQETAQHVPDDFSLVQLDQSALDSVLEQASFVTASSGVTSSEEVPR
ncbi:MAG: amino acid adenylation domain-containing protein [Phormidesmis sp.]